MSLTGEICECGHDRVHHPFGGQCAPACLCSVFRLKFTHPPSAAEAEVADLRTRLAASEAGWARVERAIEEAGEELAPRDYAECIGAIAARARKAEAALASEWERAYRAGLEAAAKQIEHAPNCHEERRKAEASGATLNAQFGCGYCAAGERARALPVPARPEDKP